MRPIQVYSLVNRRQRRQSSQARSLNRRLGRVALGFGLTMIVVVIVGLLASGVAYADLTAGLPSVTLVAELLDPVSGPLNNPTRLYDRSGTQLLYSLETPGIPRRYVYLDPNRSEFFSPELVRVTVGLLDPDFWVNPGFHFTDIVSPDPNTIAERLASNLLLWQERPGLRRALRMRLLAAQLIHNYGRTQVLEWYLNSAYFGRLAYGADSAARLYLDQPASRLDLAGAALLMAVHQAPALNPLDAPQAATERQLAVLDQLVLAGAIREDEAANARSNALQFAPLPPESASPALAFSHLVIDQLASRFGRERLERGGLRIITTLDYSLQIELNCLAKAQLSRLSSRPLDDLKLPDGKACQSVRLLPTLPLGIPVLPDSLATSAVILDPGTGQVLALIGDTTLDGEGNRLLPHSPGSLLSPLAAVAAFARGYGPASMVWDIPSSLPEGMSDLRNPDGEFHGPVRLRLAIANDYLVPQVQIVEQIGAQNVWRLASSMGVANLIESSGPDSPGATLLFGGGSASPLDLAQAYAIFAEQGNNNGQPVFEGGEVKPFTTLYVEELSGIGSSQEPVTLLDARLHQTQTVLSAPLAHLVHAVISDPTSRWPSLGFPNLLEIGRPSGAHLGRVSGENQTWTAGYTRQRVAVFWLGFSDQDASQQPLDPRLVAGTWHSLMQYMNTTLPAQDWVEPPGITHVDVCDPSGQLPTADCPNVVSEIFLTGNEPVMSDVLYRRVQINRETGRLATVFTPPALVEEEIFLVVPPEARAWLAEAGLSLPPEEYDAIQSLSTSENVEINAPLPFAYVRGDVTLRGTASGEGFDFYQIQAGQGLNPRDWLQIVTDGRSRVDNGLLGTWNTAGLNGLYAIRLMVVRQDQSVETSVMQVTVDNLEPVARVVYPLVEQIIDARSDKTITFQAEISDAVGISRVVWFIDGLQVGESTQSPYVFTWTSKVGKFQLAVIAYDLAGNQGKSEAIPFTVR